MRCVEVVQGLGSHVVIGRAVSTQTLHQVQISFFLDFAVHFCTCSQTVFCDRHFLLVANCCTLMHRENGSFEVLWVTGELIMLPFGDSSGSIGPEEAGWKWSSGSSSFLCL